jgi:hypothetical protein
MMHWKIIITLVVAQGLFSQELLGGYTHEDTIRNKWSGSIGNRFNTGYFYCSNAEDSALAEAGYLDWLPAGGSAGEYCRSRCDGRPNSWRDGWARDRCKSGCGTDLAIQLAVEGNSLFKCYNRATDPIILAIFAASRAQAEADIQPLRDAFLEKITIAMEAAEPFYSTEKSRAKVAEKASRRYQEQAQASELKRVNAIRDLDEQKKLHDGLLVAIAKNFSGFDQQLGQLKVMLDRDSLDLGRLSSWVEYMMEPIAGGDFTVADLRSRKATFDSRLNSCTFKVCSESRGTRWLNKASTTLATAQIAVDYYGRKFNKDIVIPDAPQAYESFAARHRQLTEAVRERSIIFEDKIQRIREKPNVCRNFENIALILDSAITLADRRQVSGRLDSALQNLNSEIAAQEVKWRRGELVTVLRRKLTSLQSEFNEALYDVDLSTAYNKYISLSTKIRDVLAQDNSDVGAVDPALIAQSKRVLQEVSDRWLPVKQSLGMSLLAPRWGALASKVRSLDQNVTSAENHNNWQMVRGDIMAMLGSTTGSLVLPHITSLDEALVTDMKVQAAESLLPRSL